MGYDRHHAIIVTAGFHRFDKMWEAHGKARDIFGDQVSEILKSSVNGWLTFLIGPDGSYEGWTESVEGDARRNDYIIWLRQQQWSPHWVEVQYGDDSGITKTVRDSDEYMRAKR